MKIALLIHDAYGIGGVVRATANLAAALAERHDVEVVSVFRGADRPVLPFDLRVRLVPLVDRRPGSVDAHHPLASEPSELFLPGDGFAASYSRLADERVGAHLRRTTATVVISTRPGLAPYLTHDTGTRFLRLAQEHEGFLAAKGEARTRIDAAYRRLDAVITLTEADARLHREHFGADAPHVTAIPNVVPPPVVTAPPHRAPVVMAAGRLVGGKRFDLAIEAFARLVPEHPDWRLRIYGRGPEAPRLRSLINERGLYNHVTLMGPRSPLDTEWSKAAIAVSASARESFGMTLVEAMHCGLPVVSTDCPHGPGEIVEHGTTGLLVPTGDARALAHALGTLISQDELRSRMAAAAVAAARRYAPGRIAERYESLIDALTRAEAPTVDCAVTGPGRISLRLDAASLPPADGTEADTALLLVPRDRHGEPLRITGIRHGDGICVAPVDIRALDLPEGHLDVAVQRPGRGATPVPAGVIETAALLTGPAPAGVPVRWAVPYATDQGGLALRSWRRERHAEVSAVRIDGTAVTVDGTLLQHPEDGTDDTGYALLRARRGTEAADLRIRLRTGVAGPARTGRPRAAMPFTVQLDAARLCAAGAGPHDDWDLWLVPRADGPEIRAAKLFDDIASRKRIDVYPDVEVTDGLRGPVRVRAFFTPANDLSFNAVDVRA